MGEFRHGSPDRCDSSGRVEGLRAALALVRSFAISSQPERSRFERTLEELLGRSDTLAIVAEDGQANVIGYLLASSHETFFANGPVVWIEEVMVSESGRRQGVGPQLLSAAEAWAAAIPTAYIALAGRRAAEFYVAAGYEESATYFRKTFAPPEA